MMKKGILSVLICGAMVLGLMATQLQAFEVLMEDDFVKRKVVVSQLIKMADNGIILFDSSDSMTKTYPGSDMSRYDVAKKILKERAAWVPDLGINMGLYTYTPWKAYYPVQRFDREGFIAAIDSMPARASGSTNLQNGLQKLDGVLAGLSGKTVVFVITDGTYTEMGSRTMPGIPQKGTSPALLAKRLGEKYDVCFYIISTADNNASRAVLDHAASFQFCSRVIPFSDFVERPEYNSGALFTVRSRVEVVTTMETRVIGVEVGNILFDFNKFTIDSDFEENLGNLAQFLKSHPDAYVVLAGYTCNLGDEDYNLGLSQRRVEQVAKYLEDDFNIGADRVATLWYGQMNPVADNSTSEGRRLNRRVEIAVGGVAE